MLLSEHIGTEKDIKMYEQDKQDALAKQSTPTVDYDKLIGIEFCSNLLKPLYAHNNTFTRDLFAIVAHVAPFAHIKQYIPDLCRSTFNNYTHATPSNSIFTMKMKSGVTRKKINDKVKQMTLDFWNLDTVTKPSPSKTIKQTPHSGDSATIQVRYKTQTYYIIANMLKREMRNQLASRNSLIGSQSTSKILVAMKVCVNYVK